MKHLPIKEKNIKRYIKYCDEWGYGNKDTCKYVADMLKEDLTIENKIISIKLKSECRYGLYIIVRPLTLTRDKININFDKTDVNKYYLHII